MTAMGNEAVRRHFDAIAGDYDRWKQRASFYYGLLADLHRELIPPGASVLEIGCGTGTLLAALDPARGVGVDLSPRMVEIAAARHPRLRFVAADAATLPGGETFDFVIIPDVIEHLADPAAVFQAVRRYCRPDTRVIVASVNPRWAPVLHLAERLGLKMPEGEHCWLSAVEVGRLARQAGFEVRDLFGRILLPKSVPGLSRPLNRVAARWRWLRPACLTHVLVLVPHPEAA